MFHHNLKRHLQTNPRPHKSRRPKEGTDASHRAAFALVYKKKRTTAPAARALDANGPGTRQQNAVTQLEREIRKDFYPEFYIITARKSIRSEQRNWYN